MLNIGNLTFKIWEQYGDPETNPKWTENTVRLSGLTMQLSELLDKRPTFKGDKIGDRLNGIQRILDQREVLSSSTSESNVKKIDLISGDLASLNQTEGTVHSAKTQAALLALKLIGAGYSLYGSGWESEMSTDISPNRPVIGGPTSYQGEASILKTLVKGFQTRQEIVKKRAAMINKITATSAQKLQEHIATYGPTEDLQRGAVLFHRAKLVLLAYPVERLGFQHEKVNQIIETMHRIPFGPGDGKIDALGNTNYNVYQIYSEQSFKDLKPALLELENALRKKD